MSEIRYPHKKIQRKADWPKVRDANNALTHNEIAEIMDLARRFKTVIIVAGRRGANAGRFVNEFSRAVEKKGEQRADLRSDIDFVFDPTLETTLWPELRKVGANFQEKIQVASQHPDMGGVWYHGLIESRPDYPPVMIVFEPNQEPYFGEFP